MKLSKKNTLIAPSLTLSIDAKAKQMLAEGIDVIGFGAGEPDFGTPSFIVDAAKEALAKEITKYTPVAGTIQLKKAICDKFRNDNNLIYDTSQIIVSNGAKHSLFNVFQAILNPLDEVLIPSPFWLSYPEMIKMGDGVPIFVQSDESNSFKPSIDQFKAAITNKTKALILNSPNNPTGSVYTKKELVEIAEFAVKNKLFVISDEIYEKLIYDDQFHCSIASLDREIYDLTITVNGLSKSHAMTGWRIGYAAAKREIIDVMVNVQSHATSNPNSIAQHAACKALQGSGKELENMKQEFATRRDFMIDRINSISSISAIIPKGAFYVMVNIKELIGKTFRASVISDSLSFSEMLLNHVNVAVVPGIVFGAEGYVRLSYATSRDKIGSGLDRIADFISQIN